jgi:hypothetical protein
LFIYSKFGESMSINLTKIWLFLAVTTSCLNAVDDMQMRNVENRLTALEQRKNSNGIINPPTRPVVKNGCDFWIQADALYMHATEDGLGFTIKSDTAAFPDGKVKNIDYDWSWGFRVGTGYNAPHDGWDIFLNWTWFHSHEAKGEAGTLFPTTVFPGATTTASIQATDADGHVTLRLNLVDLELGREFFVSKWLTLRPHLGIRGAWIHRNYRATFSGFGDSGPAGAEELEDEFHNRYRGVGLRSGFDSQWGLGCGWSIFGQMALSILYGKHLLHFEEELEFNDESTTKQADVRNRWTMIRAIGDFALGLRWDQLFYSDRYRIRLQLGWEQHMFFGFNKDMTFTDDTATGVFVANKGDLGMSGVAFQARLDF